MKKLYRSNQNRIIAGVCGGLAEYLELDPSVVRLVFIVLSLLGAFGFFGLIYIAVMLIVPLDPGPASSRTVDPVYTKPERSAVDVTGETRGSAVAVESVPTDTGKNRSVLGQ